MKASQKTQQQFVFVVDGSENSLSYLETESAAQSYRVEFIDSSNKAYGKIKDRQPDMIIVVLDITSRRAFRLLEMLNLDPETRYIPVLIVVEEYTKFNSHQRDVDTAAWTGRFLPKSPLGAH